ncbi:HTH_Tnp_Tc3_2 domain-containing protein [Trichonephila clavipes]|nr:HTH_Tnp_Tc3_2 domain-containing protein [Trichonephila clavipes]
MGRTGRFQSHDGSGRPRAIADREVRFVVRSTFTALDSWLSTIKCATRTRVSIMTIHRRLWCLAQSGWNHADWGSTVFSDESRFQLCSDDNRKRVWRRPRQRADPPFTIECHTGTQPDVMVWGTIFFDSQTPFVVIRNNLQDSGTSTTF